MTGVADCKLIEFACIKDPRGAVTPIESMRDVPFDIKRIFYLYDVPGESRRGNHAHLTVQEVLIVVSGSLNVHLDDGERRETYKLSCPYQGLYIPRMVWLDIDNFSQGTVCVVLASHLYDESDYIRKYEDFKRMVREKQ